MRKEQKDLAEKISSWIISNFLDVLVYSIAENFDEPVGIHLSREYQLIFSCTYQMTVITLRALSLTKIPHDKSHTRWHKQDHTSCDIKAERRKEEKEVTAVM